jgi:hypothetical protein
VTSPGVKSSDRASTTTSATIAAVNAVSPMITRYICVRRTSRTAAISAMTTTPISASHGESESAPISSAAPM